MKHLIQKVENWSRERGLDVLKDSKGQLLKVHEELAEMSSAYIKGNREDVIDGLGDTLVTLIIFAQQQKLNLADCLEIAFNEIENRKGKTKNGIFIKEEN